MGPRESILLVPAPASKPLRGLILLVHCVNMMSLFMIDISILADKSMTKQELLDELSQFYTPEKQDEFGVVGIKLKLL